jgi:hypothetical protein
MTTVFKLVYLNEETGELGKLPDFGITTIGGSTSPTFFISGKPLLFADGSSTDGTNNPPPMFQNSLQASYIASGIPANISTVTTKDIQFTALNGNKFIFDADTGQVTIEGDLVTNSVSGGGSAIRTHEHTQSIAGTIWTINHGKNSWCPTLTVYDNLRNVVPQLKIIPDEIVIINANSIQVRFNTPQIGRAVILFFD